MTINPNIVNSQSLTQQGFVCPFEVNLASKPFISIFFFKRKYLLILAKIKQKYFKNKER